MFAGPNDSQRIRLLGWICGCAICVAGGCGGRSKLDRPDPDAGDGMGGTPSGSSGGVFGSASPGSDMGGSAVTGGGGNGGASVGDTSGPAASSSPMGGTGGAPGMGGSSSVIATGGRGGTRGSGFTGGAPGVGGSGGVVVPGGRGGTAGTVGLGGRSGIAGSGGTAGKPGSSGTGGTGGTADAGVAGAAGNPGIGGSSGLGGASGTAGASGCPPPPPGLDMIDDMNDGDRFILPGRGRSGAWKTAGDGTPGPLATMSPDPDGNFTMTDTGDPCRKLAVYVQGSGYALTGVSFSVGLGSPYNASAYRSLTFWAKVDPETTPRLRVSIPDKDTDPDGGICQSSGPNLCWDHYGLRETFTTEWAQYTIPFSSLTQNAWGHLGTAFDPASVYQVVFEIPVNANFGIWIDDLAFVP